MRLRRVRFYNVYSFQEAQLSCDHSITAVIGPNDAGKTNIFRAVDHVAGVTPTLELDLEMTCQFSQQPPQLQFTFLVDPTEHNKILELLDGTQGSEPQPHLIASVRHDSLR